MGRISTRKLLESYLETGSYTETGRRLGMRPKTVQARINYHLSEIFGKGWKQAIIREKIEELLREMEGEE